MYLARTGIMHGWEFMARKDCFKRYLSWGLIKAERLENYNDEDIARCSSNTIDIQIKTRQNCEEMQE